MSNLQQRQVYDFYSNTSMDLMLETSVYPTLCNESVVKFTLSLIRLNLTLEQATSILNEYYDIYNQKAKNSHWKTKSAMLKHISNMEQAVVKHQRDIFEPLRNSVITF